MKISIPSSFSNPIVLVIPIDHSSIKNTDTKVSIYFADIQETTPVKIKDLKDILINVPGKMHIRGDATASMPKQQYTVKLSKKPKTKKFLGMEKGGKHWVFNDCGAVDYTLLRNTFAFTLQRSMKQYAPAFKFFELFILPKGTDIATTVIDATFLANNYHGLYLNFEKIRFQKSRIDLPYDKKNITSEYAIIQLNQSSDKYLQLTPNPPLTANVEVYEPKLKDMLPTVKTEFKDWFYNGSSKGWAAPFANAYSEYIVAKTQIPASVFTTIQATTDYTSFAIYFLLNEIAKDPDGYHKSTFMVKNGSICQAGPLWDKNKSYGNTASCGGYSQDYVSPKGWLYSINGQSPVWWVVLLKDPKFCKEVSIQWNTMITEILINPLTTSGWVTTFIDNSVDYIKNTGALARDSQKWPNAFNNPLANYDIQVNDLKSYLNKRIAWIDDHLCSELKKQSGYVCQAD